MANNKDKFVFVSEGEGNVSVCELILVLWSQQLGRNLGHKVSQATDSTSTADIFDLIENDVPQVLNIYTNTTT